MYILYLTYLATELQKEWYRVNYSDSERIKELTFRIKIKNSSINTHTEK